MSYQITLNTWSGADKAEAAEKLAKVFRFGNEKAMTVVDRLCQGLPWRFDRRVPDQQADMASTYLRGLGFAVDIQPVEGEIELLPDSVATAEVAPHRKTATGSSFRVMVELFLMLFFSI